MGQGGTTSIAIDTPCRQCGYSLFGRPVDGRCPECGGSIAASVHDGVLAACDPAWTAGRAVAMRGVVWGTLTYVAVSVAESTLPTSPTASLAAIIWRARTEFMIDSLIALVIAAAHWRLSSPPPDRRGGDRARRVYRAGIVLFAAARSGESALICLSPIYGPLRIIYETADWVSTAGLTIASVGFFGYVGCLADRVPSDALARLARRSSWAAGVFRSLFAGWNVWVGNLRPGSRLPPSFFYLTYGLMAPGLLVCGGLALLLLSRLRRRFLTAVVAISNRQ